MSTHHLTLNGAIEEKKTVTDASPWTLSRITFVISVGAGYAFLIVCYLGMARLL